MFLAILFEGYTIFCEISVLFYVKKTNQTYFFHNESYGVDIAKKSSWTTQVVTAKKEQKTKHAKKER